MTDTDVLVIGAGPAGTIASTLLKRAGHRVEVVEKQHFPRFSIGESLLPQCMEYLQQAGMLEAVEAAGFQKKDGAAFAWGERSTQFRFDEQFTPGWGYTYQVERDRFDTLLAEQAQQQGVPITFGCSLSAIEKAQTGIIATLDHGDGQQQTLRARFVLDASGFGRVLPRLLNLEKPSDFPRRTAVFSHLDDHIDDPHFDRDKILITVHQQRQDVWFWLIPFPNGKASLGVVGPDDFFAGLPEDNSDCLNAAVAGDTRLAALLSRATLRMPARRQGGYSASVRSLHGDGYALLGNAGEFLDPVFSSGVTIAMHSASLAAGVLDRQLRGKATDWEQEFARPLQQGVDTFRSYVSGWYDGRFQNVVFHPNPPDEIKRMICSILAGYAWDQNNPYVQHHQRRLTALAEICADPR